MVVFVDEAGDTGLKLDKGSSRFFVITLALFDQDEEAAACDQRIAALRNELGLAADFEFHFSTTPHGLKRKFFDAIVPYNFFYVSLIVDKKTIYGEAFKLKNSFYRYACSLVFDNAKQYLERATIVFDGSGSRQFKRELAAFLRHRMNDAGNTPRLGKIKMQDSKKTNLIQLADMICGAIQLSLQLDRKDCWQYRQLIGHRELLVRTWPPKAQV
jgi:hypothetical protein